jgi:iron complex outermembrane recepter protein
MLYARFASGYRPGGINNVIGDVPLPTQFQPDKTRDYELGAKGSAFDHRLSFDASVYYIDWSQIQLSLINPDNGQNYFSNGSRAKSQGLELSAQATPLNGLHLGGWVSFNDAVLTQDFPPGNLISGASGDRLPYTSRFSASTSVDYELPLGSFTAIFGATASYVGPRIGAFQTAPQRQELPGYTKTDLHATAKKDQWTVDLYINNLTDARGIVGGGIGTAVPTSFGVIQPRTTGVSVARTF